MRVGLTGLTMAENFRDEGGKDVLLFIDNIFRFTQAGSEVSALLGRMPSAVGYQPTPMRQAAASRFFATAFILVSCARAASSHPSRLQWPYAHLTTLPSLIFHRQTNACAAIWAERPSM